MLRMRGANPSVRRGESLRDSPHPFPWGGETPPHGPPPPALRAARPLRCPRRKGISPRGKHPASRPPGKKAHLLPACFGCGALPPRSGVENRFAILHALFRGRETPSHTPSPGASRRKGVTPHRPTFPHPGVLPPRDGVAKLTPADVSLVVPVLGQDTRTVRSGADGGLLRPARPQGASLRSQSYS